MNDILRPRTDYELARAYPNINKMSDFELEVLIRYAASNAQYHENMAVAEGYADVLPFLIEQLNPMLRAKGSSFDKLSLFNNIMGAPSLHDLDAFNLDGANSRSEHLENFTAFSLMSKLAARQLADRNDMWPQYTGEPPSGVARNYNGIVGDDIYGDAAYILAHQKTVGAVQALFKSGGLSARDFAIFAAANAREVYNKCFPSGTLIRLGSGETKIIESIRVGDSVAAFNGPSFRGRGTLFGKRVTRLFENITDIWIKLSNGLTVTQWRVSRIGQIHRQLAQAHGAEANEYSCHLRHRPGADG